MITRLIENTAAVKRQADRLLLALGSLTEEDGDLDHALAQKVDSNDSRLTDAREPKSHAASHGSGGSDPVTPAAIGAAAKLSSARSIDGMSFDGSASIAHYGACATAAGTAAKVVTLAGFTLVTGARISVTFTNANTAANPTLNVNGTGAKPIAKYGATAADANAWVAGAVVELVYDGARWLMPSAATSKLAAARSIRTNLASTAAASFDGSADIAPSVTGVLPAVNGGTGFSTLVNTAYGTSRLRGITLNTSIPASVPNGCIALVYA